MAWRMALLGGVVLLAGCSDGATRIAFQLESQVARFQRSDATTYSYVHQPKARFDGCAGAYDIQFSARSSLLIWCRDGKGGTVTSSHTTTYHLNFVAVPRTLNVVKAAGETTTIELAKRDGHVEVVGMY